MGKEKQEVFIFPVWRQGVGICHCLEAGDGEAAHWRERTLKDIDSINRFLVQCHRIAPSVNAIQASMLFVLFKYDEPVTQQELANELGVKPAMINRYLKPLFDRNGREMVVMKGWNCLYLTDLGKRYCNSLLTNTQYFFKNLDNQ